MSDQIQVDPFNLQRFVSAQESVFPQALEELEQGEKKTHWMWFVFPQIWGLGKSKMALKYAIGYRDEAVAYLNHPLLGPRLTRCTELMLTIEGRSAEQIFGAIDACKFKSSMSLFATAAPEQRLFQNTLDRYYHGEPDSKTLNLVNSQMHRHLGIINNSADDYLLDYIRYIDIREENAIKGYCVDDGISMEDVEVLFSQAKRTYGIVFESELLDRLDRLLHQYTKGKTHLSIRDQGDIYREACEPAQGRHHLLDKGVAQRYIETYCADHNVKVVRAISQIAQITWATLFVLLVTVVGWYLF